MLYSDIIAEAGEILRRPDATSLLFYFAKQAVRDVARNPVGPIRYWSQSAILTLPASALEVALPASHCRPISMIEVGGDTPLICTSDRSLQELGWPGAFSGEPDSYAVKGTNLILNGFYGTDTNFTYDYQAMPDTPVDSSVVLPADAELYDVILARMLYLGFMDARDPIKDDWAKIYDQRLADLQGLALFRHTATPGTLQQRRS